jgi:translation initiation factor 1 (eIF-1/SUI1)
MEINDELLIKDKQLKSDESLSFIDSKIILRFVKEKRTNRTYIMGLHDFMTDEKLITLVNDLKKKLGTSVLERKTEDGKKYYGFQGNHINTIKNILIKDLNIDRKKIRDL